MIGIDLDNKNQFQLIKTFINASNIAKTEVSETQRGHHFRIRKRCGLIKSLMTRYNLGDCKGRQEYDEMKLRIGLPEIFDTLFISKKKREGHWHEEQQTDPLSLPFFSKMNAHLRRREKWQRKHMHK